MRQADLILLLNNVLGIYTRKNENKKDKMISLWITLLIFVETINGKYSSHHFITIMLKICLLENTLHCKQLNQLKQSFCIVSCVTTSDVQNKLNISGQCDSTQLITDWTGHIKSPDYPRYKPNLNCTWHFKVSHGNLLQVTVTDFLVRFYPYSIMFTFIFMGFDSFV